MSKREAPSRAGKKVKRPPLDPNSVTDVMLKALSKLDQPGRFCVHGTSNLPLPVIRIDGLSDYLAFPMAERQVKELISLPATSQAPHGRGTKTVVDKKVRDAWRIPASAIRVINPNWPVALATLAAQVGQGLGVDDGVQLQLYNLLVYEPGGKFAIHQDSEKSEGMFGTLVVVLPSLHTGGDLVVRHRQEEVRFSSAGEIGLCGFNYVAFYADCKHELEAVQSGYRIALIYNLVRAPGLAIPPVPGQNTVNFALNDLAKRWPAMPAKMVYFLEHKYSSDGLTWQALKGQDARVGQALKDSKAFDLFLVSIQREERTDEEEESYEEQDDSIEEWIPANPKLSWVADMAKEELSDLDGNEFVQGANYLDDLETDEEEREGFTGNEGAPVTKWYRTAAIVLWPKRRREKILGIKPSEVEEEASHVVS